MATGEVSGKPFITRRFDAYEDSLAGNATKTYTAADFNFSIPDGYSLFGIVSIYAGDYRISISSFSPLDTSYDSFLVIRNVSSTARTITPYIVVSFIKNSYAEKMFASIKFIVSGISTQITVSSTTYTLQYVSLSFNGDGLVDSNQAANQVVYRGKHFSKIYPTSSQVVATYANGGNHQYRTYSISTIGGQSYSTVQTNGVAFPETGSMRTQYIACS